MSVALNDGERFALTDGAKFYFLGAVSNPTGVNGDEIVRTSLAQTQLALLIDRAAKSRARRVRGARRRDYFDVTLDPADALQVLANDCRLPGQLGSERRVLEVTTPAAARMRVRAGRTDSFATGFEDFYRVTA
jgi:hypothetical protein